MEQLLASKKILILNLLFRIFIDVLKFIFMKNLLILFCAALFFSFSSVQQNTALHEYDGVYFGKVQTELKTEYHYIVFKSEGKASTYVLNSADISKVSALIKNNTPGDFEGEYRIENNNIIYRSNNSIGKSEKPAVALSTFYKGLINADGSIALEVMFNNNTKGSTVFTFQNLK